MEKTSWHYKLEYGRYRRDGSKLYVQEATRYLLNKHLDSLMESDSAESLGDRRLKNTNKNQGGGEDETNDGGDGDEGGQGSNRDAAGDGGDGGRKA